MTVGLVAHDVGGAEVVAWTALQDGLDYLWAAEGPAIAVFSRLLAPERQVSLHELVDRMDWLLSATSEEADLEWRAIRMAQRAKKHSVVFLEHWSNYSTRLVRNGQEILPQTIWVSDAQAERLATAAFPQTTIERRNNAYLETTVTKVHHHRKSTPPSTKTKLLYVTEPIVNVSFDEHDALMFFLHNLAALVPNPKACQIVIRPHPLETEAKYLWAENYGPFISICRDRELYQEIAEADVVVGVSTMAMVVACLSGRQTVSSLPIASDAHCLPYPAIKYLRELVAESGL